MKKTKINYKKCGNCKHWMKTSDCPRENGFQKGGPSCDGSPCEKYEISNGYYSQETIEKSEKEMEKKFKKGERFNSPKELVDHLSAGEPYFHVNCSGVFTKKLGQSYYDCHVAVYSKFYRAVEIEPCKYSMTNLQKTPEFERVVKPVIEFLNNYYNPHTYINIHPTGAEIVGGVMSMKTEEFIKD